MSNEIKLYPWSILILLISELIQAVINIIARSPRYTFDNQVCRNNAKLYRELSIEEMII